MRFCVPDIPLHSSINDWSIPRSFGHTSRQESLEKLFLEGRVKGCRKSGRPRRKWTDDVCEWLGVDIGRAARLAEDRERYRGCVGAATSHPG